MPQVLALAALVAVAILVQRFVAQSAQAARRDRYRPQPRPAPQPAARKSGGSVLLTRAQLAGIRDPLTAAPIDPSATLLACCDCQSVYHHASVAALGNENRGRCLNCESRSFDAVRVVE